MEDIHTYEFALRKFFSTPQRKELVIVNSTTTHLDLE